jgi:hypothetical protein
MALAERFLPARVLQTAMRSYAFPDIPIAARLG